MNGSDAHRRLPEGAIELGDVGARIRGLEALGVRDGAGGRAGHPEVIAPASASRGGFAPSGPAVASRGTMWRSLILVIPLVLFACSESAGDSCTVDGESCGDENPFNSDAICGRAVGGDLVCQKVCEGQADCAQGSICTQSHRVGVLVCRRKDPYGSISP